MSPRSLVPLAGLLLVLSCSTSETDDAAPAASLDATGAPTIAMPTGSNPDTPAVPGAAPSSGAPGATPAADGMPSGAAPTSSDPVSGDVASSSGGVGNSVGSGGNSVGSGTMAGVGGTGAGVGGTGGFGGAAPASGGAAAGAANGGANNGGAGGLPAAGGGASGSPGDETSYEPITSAVFDEMPLFEGDPPNFRANAPAETVNGQGSISNVSVPTLRRFAMDPTRATGFGYIVFPGGAYTGLDMDTHATRLAERVGPAGIAVFALKYRVGDGSEDAPRDALLDAKRAVRTVKYNAARWGVEVEQLGVVGYSAGSHLALNLAANFDSGDANADDPIETYDSRPAFVGSLSTWAFYSADLPFTFPEGVPPVYFCHAEDDSLAPIALARTVDEQVRAQGAETMLDFYQTGGHSTCHPGDPNMPGRDWPDKFLPWLQSILP